MFYGPDIPDTKKLNRTVNMVHYINENYKAYSSKIYYFYFYTCENSQKMFLLVLNHYY